MAEAGHNRQQQIAKINSEQNLLKNDVMNTLTENIPYVETV